MNWVKTHDNDKKIKHYIESFQHFVFSYLFIKLQYAIYIKKHIYLWVNTEKNRNFRYFSQSVTPLLN